MASRRNIQSQVACNGTHCSEDDVGNARKLRQKLKSDRLLAERVANFGVRPPWPGNGSQPGHRSGGCCSLNIFAIGWSKAEGKRGRRGRQAKGQADGVRTRA